VADNKANHEYWGRRGQSVHLNYKLPSDIDAEWLYSELNVPAKMDPVGSYFMANGFGEGYFGMQVNGPKERRVLFSVWSPYDTNDPSEIPESKRIELLRRGRMYIPESSEMKDLEARAIGSTVGKPDRPIAF